MFFKINEFILEIITSLSLSVISEDGLPFPTLINLDQVKEIYEKMIVGVMILNKLEECYQFFCCNNGDDMLKNPRSCQIYSTHD